MVAILPLTPGHRALLAQRVHRDRPELDGPVDAGSTASRAFLLEYLEGMPMKDVGWER